MGILDMISSVIRDATPGAIALRTGYLQGQKEGEDRKLARARQVLLDQQEAEYKRSQIAENNARARAYDSGDAVQWVTDQNGNLVPLPKKIPKDGGTGGVLSNMKQDLGVTGASSMPSFNPAPSAHGIDRALHGGSIADDSETPSQKSGVFSTLKRDVAASSSEQGPTFKLGQPSGVKSRTPSEPLTAIMGDDGTPTLVKRSEAAGRTPYRPTGNTPHTLVTDQGIMQYDPKTDSWKPTGYTRTPASKAGGPGSIADTRKEKYYQSIAQSAIKAADAQVPAGTADADRPHVREQLAIQLLLSDPKTANVFSEGMDSRHIQSANQAFLDTQTKTAQAGARTNYTIGKDEFPAKTPHRGTPPAAGGPGATASPGSSGDIDPGDKTATPKKPLKPIADRVRELKTQGLTKDQARKQLKAEGYTVDQ